MKFKLWVKIVFILLLLGIVVFFGWNNFSKAPRELDIKKPVALSLNIDEFNYKTFTSADNVGDFLKEKGLKLYSNDLISPELEREIRPREVVSIIRNKKVSIKVDGENREINTIRKTIERILKDEGIKLNPFDKIEPLPEQLAKNETAILITRIEKKNIIKKEEINFKIVVKEDDDLKWKKQKVKQEGENGLNEVEYEMVYKNGELVSKTKISSKIIKEVQSKIIVEGRKIEVASTQKGLASWYAFTGGMKCASVRYPRGTWLRVTSKDNGKQVIVQVNDYGPDPGTGKVLDLDKVAFGELMSVGAGVINVKIEEIESD